MLRKNINNISGKEKIFIIRNSNFKLLSCCNYIGYFRINNHIRQIRKFIAYVKIHSMKCAYKFSANMYKFKIPSGIRIRYILLSYCNHFQMFFFQSKRTFCLTIIGSFGKIFYRLTRHFSQLFAVRKINFFIIPFDLYQI